MVLLISSHAISLLPLFQGTIANRLLLFVLFSNALMPLLIHTYITFYIGVNGLLCKTYPWQSWACTGAAKEAEGFFDFNIQLIHNRTHILASGTVEFVLLNRKKNSEVKEVTDGKLS